MANKLKVFRERAGLNQSELAKASGVNHGIVSLVERGIDRPAYPTASKLAKALGCTVNDLFPGEKLRQTPDNCVNSIGKQN